MQGQGVEVPGGVTEEAMEAAPVAVVEVAAGEDDLGDVAMAMGEEPAGDNLDKGLKGGGGEDGEEMTVAEATKEGVSSMRSASLPWGDLGW